MSVDNQRASKLYPMDLAPQKITIVKSAPTNDVKVTPIMTGPSKSSPSGPIITHTGLNLVRSTQQVLSQNVQPPSSSSECGTSCSSTSTASSRSESPIRQNMGSNTMSKVMNQGQYHSQPSNPQVINHTHSSQSVGQNNLNTLCEVSQQSLLNTGSQGMSSNVKSGSSRNLPSGVRLLTNIQHYHPRPVLAPSIGGGQNTMRGKPVSNVSMANNPQNIMNTPTNLSMGVNLTSVSGTTHGNLSPNVGATSIAGTGHVPRGLAAGASLAIPRSIPRHANPIPVSMPATTMAGPWNMATVRNVHYPVPSSSPYSQNNVISSVGRARSTVASGPPHTVLSNQVPIGEPPNSRGPPFVAHGYHVPKQSTSPVRTPPPCYHPPPYKSPIMATASCQTLLTGSSPTPPILANETINAETPQSVYEELVENHRRKLQQREAWLARANEEDLIPANIVPLRSTSSPPSPSVFFDFIPHSRIANNFQASSSHQYPVPSTSSAESRATGINNSNPTSQTRPSILRKRDSEGHKIPKQSVAPQPQPRAPSPWGSVMSAVRERRNDSDAGSTTVSAASSPGPSPPPMAASPPPEPVPSTSHVREPEITARKKPRKQAINQLRACESVSEEAASTSSQTINIKPQKISLLGSSWSEGWRGNALHFVRPSDVRPKPRRAPQLNQLANRTHVHEDADGWKMHHVTAQMDDLAKVEAGEEGKWQTVLNQLEGPNSVVANDPNLDLHSITELVKGSVQRSKIVSEGIKEARNDMMKIFNHRSTVGDILTRQADKRYFRKHTSQP